ncbi:MAG: SlyX family protein [Myxococcota bacterium]|nr:SlyX family protein [Myxococcota bacterium]
MDERIMDLEMRFAFQQDLLEKLNDELTEQRTLVDELTRRLEALETEDDDEDSES